MSSATPAGRTRRRIAMLSMTVLATTAAARGALAFAATAGARGPAAAAVARRAGFLGLGAGSSSAVGGSGWSGAARPFAAAAGQYRYASDWNKRFVLIVVGRP